MNVATDISNSVNLGSFYVRVVGSIANDVFKFSRFLECDDMGVVFRNEVVELWKVL